MLFLLMIPSFYSFYGNTNSTPVGRVKICFRQSCVEVIYDITIDNSQVISRCVIWEKLFIELDAVSCKKENSVLSFCPYRWIASVKHEAATASNGYSILDVLTVSDSDMIYFSLPTKIFQGNSLWHYLSLSLIWLDFRLPKTIVVLLALRKPIL